MDVDGLFQQLPTAYLVLTPDLDIVDANAAYVAISGRPREEMIGRPLFEVFPPAEGVLDEQGRNPVQLSLERARDTALPDVMPLQQYDVEDAAAGVLVERHWSSICSPILADDGSVRLLVQRVEDVTEWMRAAGERQHTAEADAVRGIQAELFVRMQELQAAREAQAAALAALRASEARVRAVLDTAADGIITVDAAGIVQSVNPAAERMFGHPAADIVGRDVSLLMPGSDHGLRAAAAASVEGAEREVIGRRSDGTEFLIELAVSETVAEVPFTTAVLRDISERKQMEQLLAHRSTHDPLTGLANRSLLIDRLEHAVARLARHPGRLAVLFIDLDRFKPVNDTWGHAAGDALLIGLAERLRQVVRSEDLVARWGGDEFVVLCEEIAADRDADVVAARVAATLQAPFTVSDGVVVHASASIGVITDDGRRSADDILVEADRAMYRRKADSRPGQIPAQRPPNVPPSVDRMRS